MSATASDPLPWIGPRVVLRRLAAPDLAAFQEYRHDERAGRYQGWTPQPDAAALQFLHEMGRSIVFPRDAWVQLGIAERAGNLLIGDIGVFIDAAGNHAEMGFTLNPKFQRQGLAQEALTAAMQLVFAHTPVARIECVTDQRNAAACRLLERVGMQRVATENAFFRGEACIEYRYRMLRAT
jgi:ribosomal-protein-alanine N-acetyltransferase